MDSAHNHGEPVDDRVVAPPKHVCAQHERRQPCKHRSLPSRSRASLPCPCLLKKTERLQNEASGCEHVDTSRSVVQSPPLPSPVPARSCCWNVDCPHVVAVAS
eukprot:6186134-Pleurochrysis_carterae.AAC.1